MAIATIAYDIRVDHDGKKYDVHVPALTAPKCSNCGAISIDENASEQIDQAFRETAGLLTPQQIREGRIAAGFEQQQDFAKCFGVSVHTLCRWETGTQIQQRFHDGMLRAFFAIPELREYLAERHGVKHLRKTA